MTDTRADFEALSREMVKAEAGLTSHCAREQHWSCPAPWRCDCECHVDSKMVVDLIRSAVKRA